MIGHVARGVSSNDAGTRSNTQKYSPGCATLFDFVVVYSGGKLRTGGDVCYICECVVAHCRV